jgi:hypothetical protein
MDFSHQVWQWNTFSALTEHTMMELQLQAGSTVVATSNFATSVFNAEWSPVQLRGPGAGLVQCHVKLRGVELIKMPAAPSAALLPEAPISAITFACVSDNSAFVKTSLLLPQKQKLVLFIVVRSLQGVLLRLLKPCRATPPQIHKSQQMMRRSSHLHLPPRHLERACCELALTSAAY